MAKFVPLNHRDHGQKTWTRKEDYRFSSSDALVPLIASELSAAASEMPIGFVREEDKFTLVALLSFRTNENLFVAPDGKWLAKHIPMALRSYPFRLLRPQGHDLTLCFDETSDCIGDRQKGEPLFDDSGSPSKSVLDVLEFLKRFEAIRAVTDIAVTALADAKTIVPWEIKVSGGPSAISVGGLYRIDELALNQLDDEGFLKLRAAHALPIAFVQLFSMQQTHKLGQLAQSHDQLKLQAAEHQRMLSEMFKLDDRTIPL